MEQKIFYDINDLNGYLWTNDFRSVLLVCDDSIKFIKTADEYFNTLTSRLGIRVTRFSDFCPNPLYESVVKGVEVLRKNNCDVVIALGGGSAMDVAKCIKLFSDMDDDINYLKQEILDNELPLIAIPTTAGTGSEATRYAVIYLEGKKQSVTHESCIPQTVVMDASFLETLPLYQRKATMLDALCHLIESTWSINATKESLEISESAIKLALNSLDGYVSNTKEGNEGMLKAAHEAGRAINITQTTAGHAMCYKLTSLYNIAHGHAAALCVNKLWPFMLEKLKENDESFVITPGGSNVLKERFLILAKAFGKDDPYEAAKEFDLILKKYDLSIQAATKEDIDVLKASVNPVRLKNNPITLTQDEIENLYKEILIYGE